jgi:hypothetical protein
MQKLKNRGPSKFLEMQKLLTWHLTPLIRHIGGL